MPCTRLGGTRTSNEQMGGKANKTCCRREIRVLNCCCPYCCIDAQCFCCILRRADCPVKTIGHYCINCARTHCSICCTFIQPFCVCQRSRPSNSREMFF